MSLIIKENRSQTLCPAGNHNAMCVAVYDLGVQSSKNGWSDKRKLGLIFETDRQIEDGKLAGQNYRISKIVSASYHPKSSVMKMLVSWFGHDPTKVVNSRRCFDFEELEGKPCTITVSHYSVDGDTKAKVEAVTPHMGSEPVIAPTFDKSDVPQWVSRMREQRVDRPEGGALPKETKTGAETPVREPNDQADEPSTEISKDDDDLFGDD